MKQNRQRKGFTMAEMLIVIAIIGVLAGIVIVGIIRYQRSLYAIEMDGIAKEIYVTAQNHLTMADSQNLLDQVETEAEAGKLTDPNAKNVAIGIPESDNSDIYYFVNQKPGSAGASLSILDLMLPYASIDDTVRMGGSYIIKYQLSKAKVLDVLYADPKGRYPHTFTNSNEVDTYKGDNNKEGRRSAGVGWYGDGAELKLTTGDPILAPEIKVTNAERLLVDVTNPNYDATSNAARKNVGLKLIITGKTSEAETSFKLVDWTENRAVLSFANPETPADTTDARRFQIVLDDITSYKSEEHFANRFAEFIPGEDIIVQAVAYNNTALTNIAYSSAVTTNSLFAEVTSSSSGGAGTASIFASVLGVGNAQVVTNPTKGVNLLSTFEPAKTASIANFRHLENLSKAISGVDLSSNGVNITRANQISDMDWENFLDTIQKDTGRDITSDPMRVYTKDYSIGSPVNSDSPNEDETGKYSTKDCYMPVMPGTSTAPVSLEYDGGETKGAIYSISNVKVDTASAAGLFSNLTGGSVKNLKLEDFDIKSSGANSATSPNGNAGALAGSINGTTIENVVAYNSEGKAATGTEGQDGYTPATGDKKFSHASPNIQATGSGGNAGGLIGVVSAGEVKYSAAALYVSANYNPGNAGTGSSGDAGGLIANISGGSVTSCFSGGHTKDGSYEATNVNVYSRAGNAGGLVGDAGGNAIKSSYSTCSVMTEGADIDNSDKYAGGLVGNTTGVIEKCYATGLVVLGSKTENGKEVSVVTNRGAFAGKAENDKIATGEGKTSYYFEIINPTKEGTYLSAIGNVVDSPAVKALDKTAKTYDDFVGAPSGTTNKWEEAKAVYDQKLGEYYRVGNKERYNLKSILDLAGKDENEKLLAAGKLVENHYGDWPAPETFVINSAS